MRAIFDANVLISFLLKREQSSHPIRTVIEMALSGQYDLVLPEDLLTEVRASVIAKPSLVREIDMDELDFVFDSLAKVATLIPKLNDDIPKATRDVKDDYLIAAAIVGDVDVLITGDKDLLVLRDLLERPRILTPADFVAEFGPSS